MVFPGGAVEECDFQGDTTLDDSGFRLAGVRETAEEVGFVLTRDGFAASPALRGADLLRSWSEMGIETAAERMTLISRWVTPEAAPKRFDTRFYLVEVVGDPEIVLDTSELEGHVWVAPDRALEEGARGNWQLILPTFAHLRWLARRDGVEDAIAAAAGADGQTVIEPVMRDGVPVVRYRGSP